ncbi:MULTISPECIES: DUF3164 family protein [Pseudoalteromonas]|nr:MULTISPECIES: DUF3164 family protein [Pseudoalteromonas]ENN99776.1 hypothetical protein J139_04205 [Pseudoalteromonas agarivorans S816]MDC9565845.1 DUF3164 family protein [Pseudoalteromonas sp. GAB2316C]MDC9570178.1 DUF3164 family protein [Pseudoalteromonas sp. GABNB9D]MDC9574368.1 DUF3164 family protein [Pseudoalteromonas sp. GABNS16A]MDC9578711.1 DUF3164 family protein [Pseudoalteromonas sp. GABNS16E]
MNNVPEGYLKDGKGNLVAIANIKQTDLIKDEFVKKAIDKALEMQETLAEFKQSLMAEADDFIELLAQEHGVNLGGKKGNVTLRTFDSQLKVTLQTQERIELGPELSLAKELIDQCLDEWTEGGNQNIKAIVSKTFNTDKQGSLNPQRILALRKLEISDDSGKWTKAMNIIAESVGVVDSTRFIRFYKQDDKGIEQAVSLDIAKL